MWIVDSDFDGQKLEPGTLLGVDYTGNYLVNRDLDINIPLENEVKSVDVVAEAKAKGGGAAGGAVLGFLLAGPVGTVVGAAAGSGNSSIAADLVAITFVRGWVLVVRRVSSEELAVLTRYRIGSEAHAAEQQRIATTVLEVPEQLPDRPHQKWSRSEEYEATDLEPARQAIEDTLPELKPIINKTFDEYAEFKWKYYGSEAYLPEEASLIAGLARSELLKVHLGELGARRRAALIKSLDKDLQDAVKRLGRDNSKIEDAEKTLKSFGIFSKSEQKTQLKETIRSLKNANGRKLAIIAVNQRHI